MILKSQLVKRETKKSKTNRDLASIYHAGSERNNSTTIAGVAFVENTELAIYIDEQSEINVSKCTHSAVVF